MLNEVKEIMIPTDSLSPLTDEERAVLVVEPIIMRLLLNVLTSVYES